MKSSQSAQQHPGVPASIYLRTEQDESGDPRIGATVTDARLPLDPMARHLVNLVEKL